MTKSPAHPTLEELSAFNLGQLSDEGIKRVETHIGECQPCCETLLGLSADDTFVELLQEANLPPSQETLDQLGGSKIKSAARTGEIPPSLLNHPRYNIVGPVGHGGMGDVFRAEHRLMERTVALKVIKQEFFRRPEVVQRFQREVKTAAKLSHSNIVTAYDAEQAGDVHYLVMEYVPGDNLSDVVKRDGPLEIAKACNFVMQAANGLQHAHEAGMVHRDIKPHNLMVTSDGQIKILDFGLATLGAEAVPWEMAGQELQREEGHRTSPNLTSAGSMMGTPDFISPEQAANARAADIRSDIYSLGCTFYYLLTGRPPFVEGSVMEKVKAHNDLDVEPIENLRVDIPTELADVVRRMMAKEPAKRFQSPAEVADALAPFVDAHRTMPSEMMKATSESRTASSRHSWWPPTIVQSLAWAAIALVLAGVVYVATENGTLVVESEDENVEIIIRPANGNGDEGNGSGTQMRIVDTVTGSKAKRLPTGIYVIELKGDQNEYELDTDRFELKRRGKVIVSVTRRRDGPRVRTVWDGLTDSSGKPSRDGRYYAMMDYSTGDLAVRDLISGVNRRVTDKGPWSKSFEYAEFPIWSPDSKRIAYSWLDKSGRYVLRISALDGSHHHEEIYRNESVEYVIPFAWSEDGQILTLLQSVDKTRQLVLVSVANRTARVLKSFGWNWPDYASISPDGRYVVYDLPQEGTSPSRDIFILSVDDNSETPLVKYHAHDFAPAWTPDGKQIVFASDRNGSVNLWVVPVQKGRADGPPQPLGVDVTGMVPMGFTNDGTFFYAKGVSLTDGDIYVADVDPSTGELVAPPEMVWQFQGSNVLPSWSPTGESLAYASGRDRRAGRVLVIRSAETGEERPVSLSSRIDWIRNAADKKVGPVWSSDGQEVLIIGNDAKGRRGILSVHVGTGEVTPVQMTGDAMIYQASWLPDRNVVYLQQEFPQDSPPISSIVSWNSQLQEKNVLHQFEGPGRDTAPHSMAISRSGLRVAFASRKAVSVAPVAGGTPRVVARAPEGQEIPVGAGIAWMPDGQSLVYATTNNEEDFPATKSTQLWRVAVDAGEPRKLGLTVDDLRHISIHPDGRRIAYCARPSAQPTVMSGLLALENFLPSIEAEK